MFEKVINDIIKNLSEKEAKEYLKRFLLLDDDENFKDDFEELIDKFISENEKNINQGDNNEQYFDNR